MVEEKITDPVEQKLRQLEDEVKSLKEPLEKTLFEVREILNTLENPFTYITALLREEGQSTLEQLQSNNQLSREDKSEKREINDLQQLTSHPSLPSITYSRTTRPKISQFINVVAAVNLMLSLVGRDNLLNIINMASWRGLISKQLAEDVKEAIDLYLRGDLGVQLGNLLPQPTNGIGNTLVVLYILSWLEKDPHDEFILILLTAFERNAHNQNNQRGYQP